MKHPIESLLRKRILILDGGMGTMIKSYRLKEIDFRGNRFVNHSSNLKGNNDLLSITQPKIVTEIHNAFLDAGSDIIETNTFSSTFISQADYKLENIVYELNLEAAKIARIAADKKTNQTPDKPRFVAGAIGPTKYNASLSPNTKDSSFRNINFDTLVIAYTEALHGLVDGGIDLILVETVFDTLNSKAAIYAIKKYFDDHGTQLPVMISGTIIDSSGKTLSGQVPEAFWNSIAHARPISVGFNCALGANELREHIESISSLVDVNVSVYPNAGHLNKSGEYDHTPQRMAKLIQEFAASGLVNLVGGCCGATPEHIRAIANAVSDKAPRTLPKKTNHFRLAGVEPLNFNENISIAKIGERINISGSATSAKLLDEEMIKKALKIAQAQVKHGYQIIEINVSDSLINGEELITKLLNLFAAEPDVSRVPVILASRKIAINLAGLKCIQGKGIVSSMSLKDGEKSFIVSTREILLFGAALVILPYDENGKAENYNHMISIFLRAYKILTNIVGFAPQNIILDTNIDNNSDIKKQADLSGRVISKTNKFKKFMPIEMIIEKKY